MTSTLRRITLLPLRLESDVGLMTSQLCPPAAPARQKAHFPSKTVIGEIVATASMLSASWRGSVHRYSNSASAIRSLLPTIIACLANAQGYAELRALSVSER